MPARAPVVGSTPADKLNEPLSAESELPERVTVPVGGATGTGNWAPVALEAFAAVIALFSISRVRIVGWPVPLKRSLEESITDVATNSCGVSLTTVNEIAEEVEAL